MGDTHSFTFEAFPGRTLRAALFTDVSNGRRVACHAVFPSPVAVSAFSARGALTLSALRSAARCARRSWRARCIQRLRL
jgi:hypothetical protein